MTIFLGAITRLYDYQREVNTLILDVAEQLSDDDLAAVIVEGQSPIRNTLVHLFLVIQINVSWWNGSMTGQASFAREFPDQDYPDIQTLRKFSDSVNSEIDTFIRSLESDSDLARVYERTLPDGSVKKRVLWEMMLHVINHGTQHRSEVAMMLTKLGFSPGDMEIL